MEQGAGVQGGLDGSALQLALHANHIVIVRSLLENGADVNTQGGVYGDALQLAPSQGHDEIVRILWDCTSGRVRTKL